MKALALSLIASLVTALAACDSTRIAPPNRGAPFTGGLITAIDSTRRYVVEAPAGSNTTRKAFFRVDAATIVERTNGDAASVKDLTVGQTVAVWAAQIIEASDPPEVLARAVLIYQQ